MKKLIFIFMLAFATSAAAQSTNQDKDARVFASLNVAPAWWTAFDVSADGNTLYVATAGKRAPQGNIYDQDNDTRLRIFDVSDPHSPHEVSSIDLGNVGVHYLSVQAGLAFVFRSGLKPTPDTPKPTRDDHFVIVDVHDAPKPRVAGRFDGSFDNGIIVADDGRTVALWRVKPDDPNTYVNTSDSDHPTRIDNPSPERSSFAERIFAKMLSGGSLPVFEHIKPLNGHNVVVRFSPQDVASIQLFSTRPPAYDPAASPSFDCKKAVTVVERTICSSRELATLDVALAKAYEAKRNQISSAELEKLKRDERDWLTQRFTRCAVSDSVETSGDAPVDVPCLVEAYRERITALESSKRLVVLFSENDELCNPLADVYSKLNQEQESLNQERKSLDQEDESNVSPIFDWERRYADRFKSIGMSEPSHVEGKPAPDLDFGGNGGAHVYYDPDLVGDGHKHLVYMDDQCVGRCDEYSTAIWVFTPEADVKLSSCFGCRPCDCLIPGQATSSQCYD